MDDLHFLSFIFQSPQIPNIIGIIEFMSARANYYGEKYSFRMVDIVSYNKSFFKIADHREKIPLSPETKIILLDIAKLRHIFYIPVIETGNIFSLEYSGVFSFLKRLNIESYPGVFKQLKRIPRTGQAFVIWKKEKNKIDVKEIYFLRNLKKAQK